MSIEIIPVRRSRDLVRFIDLPHDLYRNDPNYVPQLMVQQKGLLGLDSPFRQHGQMQLFLARRNERITGRVAAIGNELYDEHYGCSQGFFGFFDCEDDEETARQLLTACREWLADRGRTGLRGPVNPDLNNSCGILTQGFDRPPVIFMPYNAPFYGRLLEAAGLSVVKRLNAWDIFSERIPKQAFHYAERIEHKLLDRGFVLRHINFADSANEVARLCPVYNASLEGSWGHTPLTEAEFMDQASGLKQICRPEFIQIVEHEGRIVGFIGAAPDLNQVLRNIRRGRLLPWGWTRLLLGRRSIDWGRIVMYGVDPQYRGSGLAIWLYLAIIRVLCNRGYRGVEASYVLEDNRPVNHLSARLGGILAKRYVIYGLHCDER